MPFISSNSLPSRQFLRHKILLKKKATQMLIEQIIEFDLRVPESLDRTVTLTTGYFYDKAKTSKENLRVDYYLLLK